MGRRVKTEGEALEEVLTWQKEEQTSRDTVGAPIQPATHSLSGSNSLKPDYFQVNGIYISGKTPDDMYVELQGLETFEGKWSSIKLIYKNDKRYTQDEHFRISDGKMEVGPGGVLLPANPSVKPVDHIAPLKSVYWFLRAACHTGSDIISKDICQLIRESIRVGMHFAETIQWNEWGTRKLRAGISCEGWPQEHQFKTIWQVGDIDLPAGDVYLTSGAPYLSDLTLALFGDPDTERVNRVLCNTLIQPNVSIRIQPNRLGTYAPVFENNGTILNLTGDPGSRLTRLDLSALAKDYTPRVKP